MPPGPKVQVNEAGRVAQSRTYTDLLKDPHDEALFEYYCSSQLVLVNARTGKVVDPAYGGAAPRLYTSLDPSPDGRWVLAELLERPFSYTVPCGRFPNRRQLWRADGALVRDMVVQPLAETIPILKDCVRPGPRGLAWRSDAPAVLYWAEAQDGGDKRVAASPRDVVFSVSAEEAAAAPAGGPLAPRRLFECDFRYGGILWGDDHLALAYESWFDTRTQRIWALAPGDGAGQAHKPTPAKRLWRDRNCARWFFFRFPLVRRMLRSPTPFLLPVLFYSRGGRLQRPGQPHDPPPRRRQQRARHHRGPRRGPALGAAGAGDPGKADPPRGESSRTTQEALSTHDARAPAAQPEGSGVWSEANDARRRALGPGRRGTAPSLISLTSTRVRGLLHDAPRSSAATHPLLARPAPASRRARALLPPGRRPPAGEKVKRLFQSSGPRLETPGSIISDGNDDPVTVAGLRILLSREVRLTASAAHCAFPAGGVPPVSRETRKTR